MIKIVQYPDPRLRKVSERVCSLHGPEGERIRKIAMDLKAVMRREHGVGIAAIQIGIPLRLILVKFGSVEVFMVNPEIIGYSADDPLAQYPTGDLIESREGCLSLPCVYAICLRPCPIRVRWQDLFGVRSEFVTFTKLEQCSRICHEIDHLEGKLIIDREIGGGGEK